MGKGRLEAFSDGVIAILITIMVLELHVPQGTDWVALRALAPIFFSYVLSFIFLGIYWNNHHHLLHTATAVNGKILWANLHLLFWLSLIPFVTSWVGERNFAQLPVALYGVILLMSGVAYFILVRALIAKHGKDSILATAIGNDFKGKVSLVFYAMGIGFALISTRISMAVYVLVAVTWLIPDPRIERVLGTEDQP